MEKLKTGVMAYALKQMLSHPNQLIEDNVNQKDVQEAIYQLEDIVEGKAFLKNKSRNNKYVDNNVHMRLRDIVDLIKMKLKISDYTNYSSNPVITLASCERKKINTKVSITYPTQYEQDTLSNQRMFASSYLVNQLVTILLPYTSKGDFADCKKSFEMEIKRRNELELKKEELINEAEV
tara:strand:+ start:5133 stop:5669 length:537 start_codon:yes stop_codon:yes gene_type:complete